ncbi:uncharacterized protein LOC108601225 [Drosophila busckii]|uniref:uncharacterized protein LOC108601225 n=1 Tax=Drosophila busckii TaxID=30019 RepID=UPI001432EEF2|nr:uncharacterized protein LOC108601225 [Drosophila busckii]
MRIRTSRDLFTILILGCIFLRNYSKFKMTNVVCDSFNKSWVVYRECRLRAVSRNKTTLTAFVFISEPAYNIQMQLKVLKKANGYKPFLFDYTIDACKFMRTRYHPVAKMFWNLFKDISTLNHTCPYF